MQSIPSVLCLLRRTITITAGTGVQPLGQTKMETATQEIRCAHCGKLLAKGEAKHITIKCTRCKCYNTVRAASPSIERLERPRE